VAAAAIALSACGGANHASPSASTASPTAAKPHAARPALCEPLRVREVARVTVPALTEASGLVLSRGLLWTHDDSGGPATVLGISTRGKLVRQAGLPQNVDWEDIAARGSMLYVGDIGDNATSRSSITVYRGSEAIELRYPDGPHDAEALLVDGPRIVIVTKSLSGEAGIYTARGPGTLRRAGSLQLGLAEPVTGGDSTARLVVLRTYDRALVWTRRAGEPIAHALRGHPCKAGASLSDEGQGESIALARDGRSFWTLPEGPNPILRHYEVSQH
jgi:hypothetical protein